MKKRMAAFVTAGVLALSMLTGCGSKQESWKVTCPWAPSGVAAMVSQKAASKEHSVLGISGSFRQMLQNQKMLESKAENTLNRRMKMEKI